MKEITDEMNWAMVDCYVSDPVPLNEADLSKPFVYDREWGIFYVPSGYHQSVQCMLLAWRKGYPSIIDLLINDPDLEAEVKEKTYSSAGKYSYLADKFLELQGTAMKSSIGDKLQVYSLKNLNFNEKAKFQHFEIFETDSLN